MNQIQHDKIKGVLYGVAVGDALGAPVEFMSAHQIAQKYGRVAEMLGGGWLNVRPGEVTDDTQMTLCVARGIIADPNNPIAAIGENFIEWANGGPKDVGGTCAASIRNAQRIAHSRGHARPEYGDWIAGSRQTHEAFEGRSGGNGSLMRTAYIPCYYYGEDLINTMAVTVSGMTHTDPVAAEACSLYCRLIGRLLNRRDFIARLGVFHAEISNSEYKIAFFPGFEPNPTGYVKDSLLAAIWCIRQATWLATDFRKAVENAVNLGGDADTIAAITGGLAGALCGFNRIPKSWVEKLDENLRKELDELAYIATMARYAQKHT